MVLPMLLDEGRHSALVDHVVSGNKMVGLLCLKPDVHPEDFKDVEQLYHIGVASLVLKMAKADDGSIRLVAQGMRRFKLLEINPAQALCDGQGEPAEGHTDR